MENWLESSLVDLYKSAVEAFPNTTKRQYATDEIVVEDVTWTPFVGMKTLFIKGMIRNEDRKYNSLILFKRVVYHDRNQEGVIPLRASDGKQYFLEQLLMNDTDVAVRCLCQDFRWRWTHTDHLDKSLYGRNRKKYEALYNPGSANPSNSKGMCKHLMKLMQVLRNSDIIK